MVQRPPAGSIPDEPGSYQFKDRDGRVIYVGKAKSVRSRLNSYFGNPALLHPKTAQMVAAAETVDWIVVRNEVEAIMLEYSLIKQHRPRFNIRLRDDKSYPFLAVTIADEWPRAMVRRGQRDRTVRYFGPYAHAYAIRETLDVLTKSFPIRTCSDNKLETHRRLGRPCLLFHIEKCSGPCIGEIDKADYDNLVSELVEFLEGDSEPLLERLEKAMYGASDALEFEKAARVRDRIATVRKAIEKQQMVADKTEDLDVIGLDEDELEAAVHVFYVRKGRVVGRKGFIIDKVEHLDGPQLVGQILEGLYYDEPNLGVPREVLVPELPESLDVYEDWLTQQRVNTAANLRMAVAKEAWNGASDPDVLAGGDGSGSSNAAQGSPTVPMFRAGPEALPLVAGGRPIGGRVVVRVPQRGDKRTLQETVTNNAREEFTRHKMRRASDHNARARALNELQDYLDLPDAPLRIECYDMSHIQGSDYVGSMVVMEDALPNKREYRRFKIRHGQGNDDFAAMEEVLTRRLEAYLRERDTPVEVRTGRFRYPPNLLLIDGGKGQLGVAVRVLEGLGLDGEISVASLAKQFEEVFVPGQSEPIRIPRQSEALYLLQRVRDEAHRFAVTFHRELRGKRMTKSALDDVAGLGPGRKKRLLKEMGGVGAVKQASLEVLLAVPWLPNAVARALHAKLHDPAGGAGGPMGPS